jgi:two-component system cell cycle response regulator
MLDLDRYKFFNDTYGHTAGDVLMKSVVEVCLKNLRNTDVFCRFGGDEFYIMLPETNPEQACNLAERLREAVRNSPVTMGGTEVRMTLSIGVSALNGTEQNISLGDLMDKADAAMYKAKASGRDRIWLFVD